MTEGVEKNPYCTKKYVELAARGLRVAALETARMTVCVRPTPVGEACDAAGAYPLASPQGAFRISELRKELRDLGLVTLTWVQDPFEDLPETADELDLNIAYKTHFIVDREMGPVDYPGLHQRNIKRALKLCEVREIDLLDHLDPWCRLYENLIARHSLGDTHAFDPDYFRGLATIKGVRTLGAFRDGELVSGHIWVCASDRVYSHLAASSAEGYRTGAAFGVNATALDIFDAYRFVSFGGVPDGEAGDGLRRFKSGFTNSSKMVRLCGVVGDHKLYQALNTQAGVLSDEADYFPPYRV